MGRCSIDKLSDVKAVLAEIRKWPSVKEPKPGIFYIKREPFLRFHEKDSRRWADIKVAGEFEPVDSFLRTFAITYDLPHSRIIFSKPKE